MTDALLTVLFVISVMTNIAQRVLFKWALEERDFWEAEYDKAMQDHRSHVYRGS